MPDDVDQEYRPTISMPNTATASHKRRCQNGVNGSGFMSVPPLFCYCDRLKQYYAGKIAARQEVFGTLSITSCRVSILYE